MWHSQAACSHRAGYGYLDVGLFKDIRITERWRAQFRAEAFNTPHFNAPGGNACACLQKLTGLKKSRAG